MHLISVQGSQSGLYPWLVKIDLALMHYHIRNNGFKSFCSQLFPSQEGGISWPLDDSSSFKLCTVVV